MQLPRRSVVRSHASVQIEELDPTDAAARTAWHGVMERAVRAWDALVVRALAAGRTRIGGEVSVDVDVAGPAYEFARAMGAVERHREDHLLADLPVPGPPVDPAYEVVLWRGRCPEEHRTAYLAMRNQMNADVPTGDLDLQPEVLDDARLSASEEG